jgi:hypothetical protein
MPPDKELLGFMFLRAKHTVLIPRTLQPYGDEASLAINVLQCHAQNPVSASDHRVWAGERLS